MTKIFLKLLVFCAAYSLLSTTGWAQPESQSNLPVDQNKPPSTLSTEQNKRGWSTKSLSATGRDSDCAYRASKLTGAPVSDPSGQRVGQIQDIILNPASGRIAFALLSLNGNTSSSGKLTPVPWPLLKTSASSQYSASSEQPSFTLNTDRSKLTNAPDVDWSDLNQSQWRQRIYAYYGVTPPSSVGGAESPSGHVSGEGTRQLQSPTTPEQPPSHPNP